MSDNYGEGQDKVLETKNRSWMQNVHLSEKPVLTAELNLTGQIAAELNRKGNSLCTPSGFYTRGPIKFGDDSASLLSSANSGDVITSTDLTNSMYVASNGSTNIAMVNGWPINFSATATNDLNDNNFINLGTESSSNLSFVFLEVWQELVSYTDTIKKYGNQSSLATESNDLFFSSISLETSKRIQLKYRVRVVNNLSINLRNYPDGFTPEILARGGNDSNTSLKFTNMGSEGDAGLYRAGNTDGSSAETLNSVDGFVYAVPMFLVYRRANGIFAANALSMAGEKATGSTRPDGLFSDVIYPQDIVDLRKDISTVDLTSLATKTLRSIAKGTYNGNQGVTAELSLAIGGTTLIKSEDLGIDSPAYPRRVFCNAGVEQLNNLFAFTVPAEETAVFHISADGAEWSDDLVYSYVYSRDTGASVGTAGWSLSQASSGADLVLEITSLLSGEYCLFYPLDMILANNIYGALDVPKESLEYQLGDKVHALFGNSIKLKDRFPSTVISSASYSAEDTLVQLGTATDQGPSLGQVAYLNITCITGLFFILDNRTLPGTNLEVIGIRSVQNSDGSFIAQSGLSISWTEGQLTITGVGISAGDYVVCVHLGAKLIDFNKASKGVTDVLESKLVSLDGSVPNEYTVDTGAEAIYAYCGYVTISGGYEPIKVTNTSGTYIQDALASTVLEGIPYHGEPMAGMSPSVLSWAETGAVTGFIPLIVVSSLSASDSLSYIYETKGYQGDLMSSSRECIVLAEGPALITTEGSGIKSTMVTMLGVTSFTTNSLTFPGDYTRGQIKAKDYFKISNKNYRISEVTYSSSTNTTIGTLESLIPVMEVPGGSMTMAFFRDDTSTEKFLNIVDRMPTAEENDSWIYDSSPINGTLGTIFDKPVSSSVDIFSSDTVTLGSSAAGRGMFDILEEGLGKVQSTYNSLDERPENYKIFQSYIVKEKSTGRVQLAVMSSARTNVNSLPKTSPYTGQDAVDTYELNGRNIV